MILVIFRCVFKAYITAWDLENIPQNVLTNAVQVQLWENAIQTIPRGTFELMNKCVTLNLCCNKISSVEPGVWNGLDSLQSLRLDCNGLTILHDNTFCGLQHLTFLHLAGNEIFRIDPRAFRGLSSLKTLILNDNALVTLSSEAFQDLPRPGLKLVLSHPLWTGEKPWQCAGLCWLRQEERDGTVVWDTWNQTVLRPRCASDVDWETLQCERRMRKGTLLQSVKLKFKNKTRE